MSRLRKRSCNAISIHTPAKGVTKPTDDMQEAMDISIHTPAKGVTLSFFIFKFVLPISIHTPAKGVTTEAYKNCDGEAQFQSTLPRRE